MKIIRSIKNMQAFSRLLASEGKKIGLVPTMGFLHDGHLSLIKRALKSSDVVITTIFVNPAQFSPNEDLKKYPRDEKGDIRKIKKTGGEIVFIPKAAEIYPGDFETYVTVENLTRTLEGVSRPTHFRGVTTIVAKLFNITRPDIAVFGMKDFQQAIVLKRMTEDLGYPIKYVIAPTVREKDGLAMSSRNKYFNTSQRKDAVCLYRSLVKAKEMVRKGVDDCGIIKREMIKLIKSYCPTASIDYIAFTDFSRLIPHKRIEKGNTVISLAVKLYSVRLIDNMLIK